MARTRPRWWRWPLFVLGGLLCTLLALAVFLQSDLMREQVRKRVNAALSPVFQGKIQIERLGRLGLWGVAGVDVRVFDPQGRQVIRVQGLEARAALPQLGWQLAFGGDSPRLSIDRVSIDHADVTLREDEELGVSLARSFLLVEEEPEEPEVEGEGSLELRISDVRVHRLWAHGRVAGSPALDADLLEVQVELSQTQSGFTLELERTELTTRALPGSAEPGGTVWGSVDVPSDEALPLRLEGYLDGHAADSPVWLEAIWIGDELYAQLRLPELPAAYVNRQIPGLSLRGDTTIRAEAYGTLPELELQADLQSEAGHVALDGNAFLSEGLQANVSLAASGVNLAAIVAEAPPSDLRARVDALLFEVDEGELVLAHRVEVDDGQLAGVSTPPAGASGRLSLPAAGGVDASGTWRVAEPGAALRGQYRVALHDRAADFVALSAQGELSDPPRLGAFGVKVAGSLRAHGELKPTTRGLDAKLSLDLRRLDYRSVQARTVALQAQVSGSLDSPRAHAAATLELLSGRAHADLSYSERLQEASLFLADIDLHRAAKLLGVELPFEQGNLNLDLQARREGQGRTPVIVGGNLRADFGRAGAVSMIARELRLPSDLTQPRQVTGELVAKGRLDLSQADRLAHTLGLALDRPTGIVRFELEARQPKDGPAEPELRLLIDTEGLRVVERRTPGPPITTTAAAKKSEPFALEGIDAHASLRFLPNSGEVVATVIARDRFGTLLNVEGEAQLGARWLSALSESEALLSAPLKLHAEMPERRLQRLPLRLRPAGLRGQVALDAELAGSLADPRFRGWLALTRLRTQRGNTAVDLRADARGSLAGGELFARAMDRRGVDLAQLTARWQGDLRRALEQQAGKPAVSASVETELFGLPLEVVPVLAEQQLKGRISGKATLQDWGKNAQLDVNLEGRDLIVGTASLPALRLTARSQPGKLLAELGLTTDQGAAKASLEADAEWGARLLPQLQRRGLARLSARRFELATLSPFVAGHVSELAGLLDADAQVTVTAATTRVSGTAKLEQGVLQLPAIGQRFSDITARVAVANNQFELQELRARGLTGKVSVTGAARLDGFELRSANAHAVVKKREPLPLTIEGAALGDAWGDVKVSYLSPATGERKLDIDVPEFHLTTPETDGHDLQSLDEAAEIRIGARSADGTFVPLPVQPLEPGDDENLADGSAQALRVQINLGRNVTVGRGTTARAQITGKLLAISNGQTTMTGRIEITGGKLEVQGKIFEIERGVVTFDGRDASNPTITATARWDAPEYTVYAEYVGDVENGRIKLRTEPPLSQDEIASLLLFGTPDGSMGSSDSSGAALAVSVAGDTAAKGLNQALGDLTNLDVRARVDTTTGDARPELALQVSRRVVAKVTRAIGEPAIGDSPDRTFLTVELRLRRAWALSAVFGDHGGSALDLIWRHRY